MPMPIYMTLEGQNQGKIDGSCEIEGHKGEILVQAVDHTIEIPKSPQTGLPTGKRVHGPLTVSVEYDKSHPKIMQALTSGEQMKNVTLTWYRINKDGKEEKYYTTKLENAIIVSMHDWFPNALDTNNSQYGHMSDIAFTYEKIIHTWEPDGIEAEDSWLAPKS